MSQSKNRSIFIVEYGDYPEDSKFICAALSQRDAEFFLKQLYRKCEEEEIAQDLEEFRIVEVTVVSGTNKLDTVHDIIEKFVEENSY